MTTRRPDHRTTGPPDDLVTSMVRRIAARRRWTVQEVLLTPSKRVSHLKRRSAIHLAHRAGQQRTSPSRRGVAVGRHPTPDLFLTLPLNPLTTLNLAILHPSPSSRPISLSTCSGSGSQHSSQLQNYSLLPIHTSRLAPHASTPPRPLGPSTPPLKPSQSQSPASALTSSAARWAFTSIPSQVLLPVKLLQRYTTIRAPAL